MSAVNKLRALSATTFKHELTGSNRNAGPEIVKAIEDMQTVLDDIPGAGYILSKIWPGDSDTKQIEAQLAAIKQELDQMHSEMTQAYKDIMTAFQQVECSTGLLQKEQTVYSGWADFKDWMHAINDPTKSKAYVNSMKDIFLTDCVDNKCQEAARYLLNGLLPEGSFPLLSCDYLQAMYQSSGIEGYVGYRDYIATKSSVLLIEASLAMIMQTVYLIDQEVTLTPEEALDLMVTKFGTWTVDAANRIKTYVNKAYSEAGTTRPGNEKTAKIRLHNADHQTTANNVMKAMSAIYPWNTWAVTVSDVYDHVCYFDYRCDDKVSCSYEIYAGNRIVIVQVPSSYPAPVATLVNQPRWSWWTGAGEMCTKDVRDDIAACGCGGGSIVTRTRQGHMAYATDKPAAFKWTSGSDQQILAWAARACSCTNWPKCNGVAPELSSEFFQ